MKAELGNGPWNKNYQPSGISRAEDAANAKWPIVPMKLNLGTSGEILDSDEALDNFRISIQSYSANKGFIQGYEQAEEDLGWHSVEESLPEMDEEVIVLKDKQNTGLVYEISFGHLVDTEKCIDYNGWNVPDVKFWMPMPKIPEEQK